MTTHVADFIEASRKSRSLSEISQLFERTTRELGFHKWAYQIVNPPYDKDKKPLILSNYPEKWVSHYVDRKYNQVDHVILKGPHEVVPFTWSSLCQKHGMTSQQKMLFGEAATYGLPDGLGVPVHGSNGGYAMISIATEIPTPELERMLKERLYDIHVISLVFNTVTRDLLDAFRAGGTQSPALTNREKECLLWMSRGKTVWDTGQILGISEAVVKFHLANARAKLGCLTTKEAMVLAIMHKLIQP